MVIDDALRVAGRARGVVERDRAHSSRGGDHPNPGSPSPRKSSYSRLANCIGPAVGDLDDRQLAAEAPAYRAPWARIRGRRSAISPAVVEDEGDRGRVEPVVERVQHRAGHRHRVMRFEQRRHVRRQHRDGVAGADAAPRQRIGEAPAARVEFAPGEPRSPSMTATLSGYTAAARARKLSGVSAAKFAALRARCGASYCPGDVTRREPFRATDRRAILSRRKDRSRTTAWSCRCPPDSCVRTPRHWRRSRLRDGSLSSSQTRSGRV
jgi:hypothetical protein